MNMQKTIAVVTSTIGRPELIRAIESVKAQKYPCKHYIFVDGEQYHDTVREMVKGYSDLIVTYLPMNTGANGWINSFINATAPFLVKEDIICYLDDDNWYDPEHTEAIANAFNQYNIDMAFNLRRLCDDNGDYICDDNVESLGFWSINSLRYSVTFNNISINMNTELNRKDGHIDTNCLGFSTPIARELANEWTKQKYSNDHYMLRKYFQLQRSSFCTGIRTVNYIVNFKQFMSVEHLLPILNATANDEVEIKKNIIKEMNNTVSFDLCQWLNPHILRNNQLITLEK